MFCYNVFYTADIFSIVMLESYEQLWLNPAPSKMVELAMELHIEVQPYVLMDGERWLSGVGRG